MAKGANQKLKLLYLMKILLEETDENHGLTMQEILDKLKAYDITAERKSIYSDIESLRQYDLDIIGEQIDKTYRYYVGERPFELAELKLLVDSVQSAKFITAKKSNELIKKIEGLSSKHEAKQLHRQVVVTDRVKSENKSVYYNVDKLHNAIASNKKISFQYFQWDINKNMVLRHDGKVYKVSPWALSWDDENYYLIAFDTEESKIKHFRVDKMLKVELCDEKRDGKEAFREFDLATYAKKLFGMFGGEEETVCLQCSNDMVGIIIDRFGKDIIIIPVDDNTFCVNVKVSVSRQFFAWVISLGEGVKITGPEHIVQNMKSEVERLKNQYLD